MAKAQLGGQVLAQVREHHQGAAATSRSQLHSWFQTEVRPGHNRPEPLTRNAAPAPQMADLNGEVATATETRQTGWDSHLRPSSSGQKRALEATLEETGSRSRTMLAGLKAPVSGLEEQLGHPRADLERQRSEDLKGRLELELELGWYRRLLDV